MPSEGDEAARRLENLRAVLAGKPAPPPSKEKPAAAAAPLPAEKPKRKGIGALTGGIITGLVFLAGKLKFLTAIASLIKLKTFVTMLLSIGVYATSWGLPFAIGFVLLILVHELGHAAVMRREGIPAGAPVFIPFLGAVIAMRGMPRDAYVEAKVAIGGPIAGSIAAWAVLAVGLATANPLLVALGHTGAILNLFNLIPVSPLDGGRIAGAFTKAFWIVGYAIGVLALIVTRSPILLLVLVIGLITLWQRLRKPIPGYDAIPRAQRLAIGVGYAVLVAALAITATVHLPE